MPGARDLHDIGDVAVDQARKGMERELTLLVFDVDTVQNRVSESGD